MHLSLLFCIGPPWALENSAVCLNVYTHMHMKRHLCAHLLLGNIYIYMPVYAQKFNQLSLGHVFFCFCILLYESYEKTSSLMGTFDRSIAWLSTVLPFACTSYFFTQSKDFLYTGYQPKNKWSSTVLSTNGKIFRAYYRRNIRYELRCFELTHGENVLCSLKCSPR